MSDAPGTIFTEEMSNFLGEQHSNFMSLLTRYQNKGCTKKEMIELCDQLSQISSNLFQHISRIPINEDALVELMGSKKDAVGFHLARISFVLAWVNMCCERITQVKILD